MLHSIFDMAIGIAAVLSILDYFGIKPKGPEWLATPLNRKWRLAIMLSLVAAALGMSGYDFYRSFRPKVIETVVTKTVEKPVPIPCPEPPKAQQSVKKKNTPNAETGKTQVQSGKDNVQSGSITQGCGSIQEGGAGNSANVNCGPPPLKLTWSATIESPLDNSLPYQQVVKVIANVDFHPVSLIVVCDQEIKRIFPVGIFNYLQSGVAPSDNKVGYVYYPNPPLAPGVALNIRVFSDKPFTVLNVQQEDFHRY